MATLILAGSVIAEQAADAVVVDGDTIRKVGLRADLEDSAVDGVLDLGDLTLGPGLVDTHVHMTGNGLPSAPVDIQREPASILLLRAAENARRALEEGVTTMRDCGARNDVIFEFRDAANSGVVTAPNILATGGSLTRTGGHGHWWGLEADSDDEIRKAVRAQSKAGADALKVMVDAGIDIGRTAPGLLLFDEDALGVVVREARNWGLDVAAHCLTAAGIRASVAAGVSSIEHCIFYERDIDDSRYDPEVGRQIADKGIYVDPGPAFAYDVFAVPGAEEAWPRNARLFRTRLEETAHLRRQGVEIVAGTDAGWYATPFGQFARCPELWFSSSELDLSEIFRACTSVAAESLGLGAVTGTIAPGYRADLVAFEGDPREDVAAYRGVRMTMVRGSVVFDDGVAAGSQR